MTPFRILSGALVAYLGYKVWACIISNEVLYVGHANLDLIVDLEIQEW